MADKQESNANTAAQPSIIGGHPQARSRLAEPLVYSGSLDKYAYTDLTTAIGREFTDLQVPDLLAADDQVLRDLAVTISQRGVVFFRNQDHMMPPAQMVDMMTRLSEQSGCPSSSGLSIHPLAEPGSEFVFDISSAKTQGGGLHHLWADVSTLPSAGWHSDGAFEPAPADYSMLRMVTVPPTGGDTIWCSTYDLYDRLSPPMARMLEGLKARHDSAFYHNKARLMGQHVHLGERGSPLNSGSALQAEHPVIRTHPVTGWKSLFINQLTTKRLLGVTYDESHALLAYLLDLVPHSHDLQVRFKWRAGDVAVWDNRCTVHTATHDYTDFRQAHHVRSLGEAPYLDPASTGKKEALLAQSNK